MNRFTFGLGYKEYNIDIDSCKFLVGNDIKTKFSIYSVIKSTFSKVNNSEYATEDNKRHIMRYNDRQIDLKNWKLFEVTPFFDLETDMKMGSKSLMLKYLECFGDSLEQSEIYSTLSILINSLNEEFFDEQTEISFGDKKIKFQIGEFNRGTLAKEIYPVIIANEYECNSADMNYEDIILLQLSIIDRIVSKGIDNNAFIYCNIPYLTPKIKVMLYGIKYNNAFVLVDTNSIPKANVADIYITGKYSIDLANDEDINDKIMDLPFHIEKEEFKNIIYNCLLNQKLDYAQRLIVELFS